VGRRWPLVGSLSEFWEALMCEVGACGAAGKMPPHGWTKPDESGKGISLSDVSRFGESTIY
jgi:hypothetical protein